MDTAKVKYVFRFYGHLMTEHERMAYRHLLGTAKATRGRTDADAQAEANDSTQYLRELQHLRDMLSDDPRVLLLGRDGLPAFVLRTGQRILRDHQGQIVLNCCPRCSGVARTPTARQCRFCGYDWHDKASPQTTDRQ
jgi:hypothetical protein